nr:ATP-binding cassette domain-containing protein [Raoultella sp. RIT712]
MNCISNTLVFIIPVIYMSVIDRVLVSSSLKTLNSITALIIVIAIFQGVVMYSGSVLRNTVNAKKSALMIFGFYNDYLNLKYKVSEKYNSGDVISRLNEIDGIKNFRMHAIISLPIELFFLLLYIFVILSINEVMMCVVLLSVPFLLLQYSFFKKTIELENKKLFNANVSHTKNVIEGVDFNKLLKINNSVEKYSEKISTSIGQLMGIGFKLANILSISNAFAFLINKCIELLLLYLGAKYIISGTLTLGQFVGFNMFKDLIVQTVVSIPNIWDEYIRYKVSQDRIRELLSQEKECHCDSGYSDEVMSVGEGIVFNKVTFGYSDRMSSLCEVSFTIDKPGFYGVIGMSGSGKSTIFKLLVLLYDNFTGEIYYNGVDIRRYKLKTLRDSISLIDAQQTIFTGSIKENILIFSNRKDSEWLHYCASVAELIEFVSVLPDGFDTIISGQNNGLSAGQVQRVILARAIATDRKVMIFDEATNALDEDIETKILEKLRVDKSKIFIFITHRKNSLESFDKVFSVSLGRIKEVLY